MSISAHEWAMQQRGLGTSRKFVLVTLADRANDDGTGCFPSIRTIADETDLSVRSVQYHLKALEQEHRLIRRYPRVRQNGSRSSDDYVLLCQPPATHCTPPVQLAAPPEPSRGTQGNYVPPDGGSSTEDAHHGSVENGEHTTEDPGTDGGPEMEIVESGTNGSWMVRRGETEPLTGFPITPPEGKRHARAVIEHEEASGRPLDQIGYLGEDYRRVAERVWETLDSREDRKKAGTYLICEMLEDLRGMPIDGDDLQAVHASVAMHGPMKAMRAHVQAVENNAGMGEYRTKPGSVTTYANKILRKEVMGANTSVSART